MFLSLNIFKMSENNSQVYLEFQNRVYIYIYILPIEITDAKYACVI